MKLKIKLKELKGGVGSGHRGHAGRPGDVGGSLPGKGGGAAMVKLVGTDEKILRDKGWKQQAFRHEPYFTKSNEDKGYMAQIAGFAGDMWKWKVEAFRGKRVGKILAGGTSHSLVEASETAEKAMTKDYRRVDSAATDLWA